MIKIKKKYRMIASFLLVVLIMMILYIQQPTRKEICIEAYQNIVDSEFHGIVKDKYYGYHNVPYISLNNGQKVTLLRDLSGLFDFVLEGDSIYKNGKEDKVFLIRNEKIKIFELDFKCEKY